MDKKIIAGVLLFSALVFVIAIFIPTGNNEPANNLPWQITPLPDGATEVFGIKLNHSTLQQSEQALRSVAKVSQFIQPNGEYKVEAYFDKVSLSGLSAKIVLTLEIPQATLKAMYQRGTRISTLGSGTHRVTLHADDLSLAMQSPVSSITYLPSVPLSDALIKQRFGEPAQIVQERDSTTHHWLYPKLGLDITIDHHGNAVLQYVSPKFFNLLSTPLQTD